MNSHRVIVEAACGLACTLPSGTIEDLALSILTTGEGSLRAEVARRIPHFQHRDTALAFVEKWRREAAEVGPQAVAVALQTAGMAERTYRDLQSVELVWTGPGARAPFRRTEQAILQVLDLAKKRITLVSYAVYRIPNIRDSLVRAASRGVQINVIVETPDRLECENEYSTLRALGEEVAACSAVFFWPKEGRGTDEKGKPGILHVKCAVADDSRLFLSSANLTEHAFKINMELGILVTGGRMPVQVQEHFDHLIADGVVVPAR